MNYFIMYFYEDAEGLRSKYESFIYENKIETQQDFNKLKNFIRKKNPCKGHLSIVRITPLPKGMCK